MGTFQQLLASLHICVEETIFSKTIGN